MGFEVIGVQAGRGGGELKIILERRVWKIIFFF
jgi:hypothetical protein